MPKKSKKLYKDLILAFNSLIASFAIHLAEEEFCFLMFSAHFKASTHKAKFFFPIWRRAQFTAFLTKFLLSYASLSIIGKKLIKTSSLTVFPLTA